MPPSWTTRIARAALSFGLAGAGLATPVAAGAAVTPGPSVRLVVVRDAGTSSADVLDALDGDVAVRSARSLPELSRTTVDVARVDVGEAVGEIAALDGVRSVRLDGRVAATSVIPNDPLWAYQSSLASIGLPEAWATSTGASSAVIAVVDTGVEANPDLGGRLLPGYDFVNGDADPDDDNGHGSDVATVAAATGNDAQTMAGVCWACQVLPVKALDATGTGYMSDVASGILYAVNHGATIINLSLGSPTQDAGVSSAVNYARSHDVVVVAAAGNDGSANRSYPAADTGVIAVAGTDSNGALYSWSQRGSSWVDVAAPGCNVADGGGAAGSFCGTSSATPVVTGTLGLMRSHDPSANAATLTQALVSTTTPLASAGQVAYGRINANLAVAAADPNASGAPTTPPPPPDLEGPTVSIESDGALHTGVISTVIHATDSSGVASVTLFRNGEPVGSATPAPDGVAVISWSSAGLGDGAATLVADAIDGAGNHAQAGAQIRIDNVAPRASLSSAMNGKTVTKPFSVGLSASDGNGAKVTLIVANARWVAGFSGNTTRSITITPPTNGRFQVIAVTIDQVGHAAYSNVVTVNAKLKRPPARRR